MESCDMCQTKTAKYDARIPAVGSWANVCEDCFKKYGCSLGVGKGSLLDKPKPTGEKLKPKTIDDYSEEELQSMMFDSVIELDCGCSVEPDGRCPCGNNSPLIDMGLI